MKAQSSIENLSIILVVLAVLVPLSLMAMLNARSISSEKGLEDVRNFLDFLKSNTERVVSECPSQKEATYYIPFKIDVIEVKGAEGGVLFTLRTRYGVFKELASFNPEANVGVLEFSRGPLFGTTTFTFSCESPAPGVRVFSVSIGG